MASEASLSAASEKTHGHERHKEEHYCLEPTWPLRKLIQKAVAVSANKDFNDGITFLDKTKKPVDPRSQEAIRDCQVELTTNTSGTYQRTYHRKK